MLNEKRPFVPYEKISPYTHVRPLWKVLKEQYGIELDHQTREDIWAVIDVIENLRAVSWFQHYPFASFPTIESFINQTGTRNLANLFRKIALFNLVNESHQFTTLRTNDAGNISFDRFEAEWRSWLKPEKRFSGDSCFVWSQYGVLFGVVSDGATMLASKDELPEYMKKLFTLDGQFLPDHVWNALTYRNFFQGSQLPTQPSVMELVGRYGKENFPGYSTAQEIITQWQNDHRQGNIPGMIMQGMQNYLRSFYAHAVPEVFKDPKASQLPSGVSCIFALFPSGQFQYVYTGDVSVSFANEFGEAYRETTDHVGPTDVGLDMLDRSDRTHVLLTGDRRISTTGNLTGVLQVPLHYGQLFVPPNCGVVVNTDGDEMRYVDANVHTNMGLATRGTQGKVNIGASLRYRDMLLAHLKLVRAQDLWQKWRKDPDYPKGVEIDWRADEGTSLVIRHQERTLDMYPETTRTRVPKVQSSTKYHQSHVYSRIPH